MKNCAALLVAAMAITSLNNAARAENWPTRPVHVIVPITGGSAIDIVARAVSQRLEKKFGQPFVVENRPGAGTTLGAAVVARAPADGYTILFDSAALTTTPTTVANLSYNVDKNFAAVAPVVETPLVLVTQHAKYKSLADLVTRAKADAAPITYGTNGYGSAAHFTTEKLLLSAGFKGQAVPYRGTPEALAEVMAGRLGFYFSPLTAAQALIKAGKVDALAVTSTRRSSVLPDVPTTVEAGYSGSDFDFWVGIFAPAHTPEPVVASLAKEVDAIKASEDFKKAMAAIGGDPMASMTPAQFQAYVGEELKRNKAVAKAAGIEPK